MARFLASCLLLSLLAKVTFAVEISDLVPPLIDVAPILHPDLFSVEEVNNTFLEISTASQRWGFYHVLNHDISGEILQRMETQMRLFFSQPLELKRTVKRSESNSRGYANDELTKQRLDQKEIYDLGPGSSDASDLSAEALRDLQIDGFNQWVSAEALPDFRNTIEEYFEASYNLSMSLMRSIAEHLPCFGYNRTFFDQQFNQHSSIFRLNHYPTSEADAGLGISRHTDAGVLTVLWQDPMYPALEVYSGSKEHFDDGQWIPVDPIQGALTINAGDMLQVWTNNLFKAPEHRVQSSKDGHDRHSAAFFLNPNYDTIVAPRPCNAKDAADSFESSYAPIRWGDFRIARFRGDYADVGEEIQIEKYKTVKESAEVATVAGVAVEEL